MITHWAGLNWALLAISLFNTIVLLWLGLTVFLGNWQRLWGNTIASLCLLTGSVFFAGHSALLAIGLQSLSPAIPAAWTLGGITVIALPYAWFGMSLWYTGWVQPMPALRWPFIQFSGGARAWRGLAVAGISTLATLILFGLTRPTQVSIEAPFASLFHGPTVGRFPLFAIAYPVTIVFCVLSSISVLESPRPAKWALEDRARERAKPWLLAASLVLLLVSLGVAWVLIWTLEYDASLSMNQLMRLYGDSVGWIDLAVDLLILIASALLGSAIAAYEIFSRRALPQGGLQRQWRNALIFATGFSCVSSAVIAAGASPVWIALTATVITTTFYALLHWRDSLDHQRQLAALRPILAPHGLVQQFSQTGSASARLEPHDAAAAFAAICRDTLSATRAMLIPAGPTAALHAGPLTYPANTQAPAGLIEPLLNRLGDQSSAADPSLLPLAIDPALYSGASWAVPLWDARGHLSGVLLLGDKATRGLYTQEEIEIAQASGERLLDLAAGAELARRLSALQRQRLTETQVADRRTRRTLHDEVLPNLHAAMLSVSDRPDAVSAISAVHKQIATLLREMPPALPPQLESLGMLQALQTDVTREYESTFTAVDWTVSGEAEAMARGLPPLQSEVAYYAAREAIRNAARYGAHGPLRITAAVTARDLAITFENSAGDQPASGGAGQGLMLHSTLLAVIGGSLNINQSTPGHIRVTLTLPG